MRSLLYLTGRTPPPFPAEPEQQENVHVQFEEVKFNTRNSVESIRERITIVERRLFEIEKKLLMNPPAA
jgi:hypothetical protein